MVATIFGTRPEITKLAPLIPLIDAAFDHHVLFTSQHYSPNMAQLFFDELQVREPDTFLDLRTSAVDKLTAAVAEELKRLRPRAVVVYGDTNSTLAAGRAAREAGLPLAHIEAGLRCFDLSLPEERTRIEVDGISDLLLCPTELQVTYLRREGVPGRAEVVGNLIVDAVQRYLPSEKRRAATLRRLGVSPGKFAVATIHRQANVDTAPALKRSLECLRHDIPVVFPVHPRTRARMDEFGLKLPENVVGTEPLGYLEFLSLLAEAAVVLTDSGGLQEEAIVLGVPCLTLRTSTERWETVCAGGNFLVGTEPALVQSYVAMILDEALGLGERMRRAPNPYGENVAQKCLAALRDWLARL